MPDVSDNVVTLSFLLSEYLMSALSHPPSETCVLITPPPNKLMPSLPLQNNFVLCLHASCGPAGRLRGGVQGFMQEVPPGVGEIKPTH